MRKVITMLEPLALVYEHNHYLLSRRVLRASASNDNNNSTSQESNDHKHDTWYNEKSEGYMLNVLV